MISGLSGLWTSEDVPQGEAPSTTKVLWDGHAEHITPTAEYSTTLLDNARGARPTRAAKPCQKVRLNSSGLLLRLQHRRRDDTTIKLTRRLRAEAVSGRVQRLVVLPVVDLQGYSNRRNIPAPSLLFFVFHMYR